MHVMRVSAVTSLVCAGHITNIGNCGRAHPKLKVCSVRKVAAIATDVPENTRPDDCFGAFNRVSASLAPLSDPIMSVPDNPVFCSCARGRKALVREFNRMTVCQADQRVVLHQRCRSRQASGSQEIVSRKEYNVISRSVRYPFVVCGYMAFVFSMADRLDSGVLRTELANDLLAPVR